MAQKVEIVNRTWLARLLTFISQAEMALYQVLFSVFFLVFQVVSAPCTSWFFWRLCGGQWWASSLLTVMFEIAGLFCGWELSQRLIQKDERLGLARPWIGFGLSVMAEGTILWTYLAEHNMGFELWLEALPGPMYLPVPLLFSGLTVLVGLFELLIKAERAAVEVLAEEKRHERIVLAVEGEKKVAVEMLEKLPVHVPEEPGSNGTMREQLWALLGDPTIVVGVPDIARSPTAVCDWLGWPESKRSYASRLMSEWREAVDGAGHEVGAGGF